uniref:Ribose 1,5-bisphosphate phosphokinase PhnN n=1 Tax=Rhodopseudomonas palustris (strain BisA53) TaxID=316055 RepID=Q07LZ4_RHOP5
MTEVATIARDSRIGPGRLVLVVGPSGAGKDTLIALAREACRDDAQVVFPRRVVTRESSPAEDNVMLTLDAFKQAAARGAYAIHWEAHGHCYGIPKTVDDDIRAGRSVVANVSRAVVPTLRAAYAEVVVVAVTAPAEVLAKRLAGRARPSDGDLIERLHRSVDSAAIAPEVTIINVGAAEQHAAELLNVIRG